MSSVFAQAIANRGTANLPIVPSAQSAYALLKPFDHATVTKKKNVTHYDPIYHLPDHWTETTFNSVRKDKKVDSIIDVTYETNTQRQATYAARIHESGKDALGKDLDKVTHLFRTDFVYNSFDEATSFIEMSFESEDITVNGVSANWSNLSALEKQVLASEILKNLKGK